MSTRTALTVLIREVMSRNPEYGDLVAEQGPSQPQIEHIALLIRVHNLPLQMDGVRAAMRVWAKEYVGEGSEANIMNISWNALQAYRVTTEGRRTVKR